MLVLASCSSPRLSFESSIRRWLLSFSLFWPIWPQKTFPTPLVLSVTESLCALLLHKKVSDVVFIITCTYAVVALLFPSHDFLSFLETENRKQRGKEKKKDEGYADTRCVFRKIKTTIDHPNLRREGEGNNWSTDSVLKFENLYFFLACYPSYPRKFLAPLICFANESYLDNCTNHFAWSSFLSYKKDANWIDGFSRILLGLALHFWGKAIITID